MNGDIIEELAAAIAGRIAPVIPLEIDLWSSEQVAHFLKRDRRQVVERIAALPDFPKAIRLPAQGGGRSQPLWKAIEVIEWATGYQEGAGTSRGRARKAA